MPADRPSPAPAPLELPPLAKLRGELTTTLARALADGRGAGEDAEAAARRVLDGHGLPAAWRQRIGDGPAATLVAFDADRIQSWVFSSEKVQVAGGASFRLESINRRAAELVGEVEGISGLLYSAGGGGMLFAEPGRDPDALAEAVRRGLAAGADGLSFTVVATRLAADDLEPTSHRAAGNGFTALDGVGGALVRTQVAVRRRKEERPPPAVDGALERTPNRAADRCRSCGRRPPASGRAATDDPQSWCSPCQERRREFQKRRPGEKVTTFERFAEANGGGRRYLAFLALDGNGMGGIVQEVPGFLQLRAFSEATSRIYEAARGRIREVLGPYLRVGQDALPPDESFLSLLSGGDEISVVLPSSAAPETAAVLLSTLETLYDGACAPGGLLADAFAANPDQLARLRRVGAAVGLIVAPGKYPVRLLRRYAGDLQKQAKRFCAEAGAGDDRRSAVAWRLLTDSSPLTGRGSLTAAVFGLAEFRRRLREAAAAAEEDVPLAALRQVLDVFRREEASVRSLPAAAAADPAARVTANFLLYQTARHPALASWWRRVAPQGVAEPAVHRLLPGADDFQGLLDLLSLRAAPAADEVAP